jgi:hypothetical protein
VCGRAAVATDAGLVTRNAGEPVVGKRAVNQPQTIGRNVGVGRSDLAGRRATVAMSTFWEKLVGALDSESDEVEPGFDSRAACSMPPAAAL